MNGPEHYKAAEELLVATQAMAAEAISGPAGQRAASYAAIQSVATAAQAHATLALVAAQIDAVELHSVETNGHEAMTEWGEVTR